jgi:hypothetical protein
MAWAARTVLASVALPAIATAGVGVTASAAHGGAAEITVVDQSPTGPTGVDFRVQARFVLDQHPAVPATFVVSATGPDGATVAPTDLAPTVEEGVYEVGLEFPSAGVWDVTFAATLPPGELTEQVAVGDAQPTNPPPSGDDAVGGESEEPTVVASEGSGAPTALVVGVVGAGLVTVVGLWLVVRGVRRRDERRTPST